MTPQEINKFIEKDFERLQYHKTNGLPQGLTWKNISLGNILDSYDDNIPNNTPVKRNCFVISNTNVTVDIIIMSITKANTI